MNLASRFKANCKGNTTMMFALALVPLSLAAGAAVDMVQTNRTLTVLQGAADAAALAGGASGKTDAAELRATVEDYLNANGAIHILSEVDSIDPVLDQVGRTFSVRIKGKRNTAIMHLAGIDTMELGAFSQVKLGGDGLEVALVLDNTASMNAEGRLPALKDAANALVDDLMEAKANGAYVRVGIVPFSDYVNVGLGSRNEPWINVPPDSTTTQNICRSTYPNAVASNCHDETRSGLNDGVPTTWVEQVCDWNYGDPVTTCSDESWDNRWYGCVGSRAEPLDENIGTPSSPYPGLQNAWCTTEIVPLTDNKATLKNTIDGLVAVGNTYIPAGLMWGWNMVDSNRPLEEAKPAASLEAMGGTKAVILMTDGENTLSADYPWHWGSDAAKANAKTATLCQNIKDDNIVVYTVSFMVTATAAKTLLEECATDPSKAFTADNAAQLSQAFKDIGSQLMAMRLSK